MLPYAADRTASPGHSHSNTQDPGRAMGQLSGYDRTQQPNHSLVFSYCLITVCFSTYRCPVIWRPWTLRDAQPEKVKYSPPASRVTAVCRILEHLGDACFFFLDSDDMLYLLHFKETLLFFYNVDTCWITRTGLREHARLSSPSEVSVMLTYTPI